MGQHLNMSSNGLPILSSGNRVYLQEYEKMLQRELEKLEQVSKPNKSILKRFYSEHCVAQNHTPIRAAQLLSRLRLFSTYISHSLDSMTEDDLKKLNIVLVQKKLRLHTIKTYKKCIKVFLRFLKKNHPLIESDQLKYRNPYLNGEGQLDVADMPTDEEVIKLFKAFSPYYQAMLAFAEGAGLRINSIGSIQRNHLKFNDDSGLTIFPDSKTGKRRLEIRPEYASYIREWYEQSPFKEPTDFLFATRQGNKAPSYDVLRKELIKAGKVTGIYGKRKLKWHIFRHRAATWSLKHLSPLAAKQRIWGNTRTTMSITHIRRLLNRLSTIRQQIVGHLNKIKMRWLLFLNRQHQLKKFV